LFLAKIWHHRTIANYKEDTPHYKEAIKIPNQGAKKMNAENPKLF